MLLDAIREGNTVVVELLIKIGTDVNHRDPYLGETAIEIAIENNHFDIISPFSRTQSRGPRCSSISIDETVIYLLVLISFLILFLILVIILICQATRQNCQTHFSCIEQSEWPSLRNFLSIKI